MSGFRAGDLVSCFGTRQPGGETSFARQSLTKAMSLAR